MFKLKRALGTLLVAAFFSGVEVEAEKNDTLSRVMLDGGRPVPMWIGRLDTSYDLSYFTPSLVQNSCSSAKGKECSLIPGESYPYKSVVLDPQSDNPGQPILKVQYPAGSWSPGSARPGGVLIYAYPTKTTPFEKTYPISTEGATLEYEVYFPHDFQFVKGGKLPGLMGGASNGIGCGGGNRDFDCFSYRIMWRREGFGEAYIYAPFSSLDPEFCSDLPECNVREPSVACNHCDGDAGYSIGRATFRFQPGAWTKMKLQMQLNTPGIADGLLKLVVNDDIVIYRADVQWRTAPDVAIEGVTIASWFGGSDSTWAPTTDQETWLKNFRLYYDGPQQPMARSMPVGDGPQVVIEMEIEEMEE